MRHWATGQAEPVIVALPGEVDAVSAGPAWDRLDSAIMSGAPVVIADCTATAYCDAAGMRSLLLTRARAAARGVQFRLVIPPGALLRRLLILAEADHLLPVYSTVGEASLLQPVPARHPYASPDGHPAAELGSA